MLDGVLRRVWLLGVPLGLLAAALVIALAQPWDNASATVDDLHVEQATLRPGKIVLRLLNDSEEEARVAQVIVNDAYVDFRRDRRVVGSGATAALTLSYPWVEGESYEVEVMTSTGATVEYEIEDAEEGTQTPDG